MATKTVACPECGSAAAPGRYTCGECGALLDGVAVRPRTWDAEGSPERPADADADTGPEPTPDSAVIEPAPALAADAADAAAVELEDAVAEPVATAPAVEWPVRDPEQRVVWPARAPRPASPSEAATVPPAAGPAAPAVPDGWDPPAERPSEPVWPPPGDLGPLPAPEPRVPAGVYLPPSARLERLDPSPAAAAGANAGATAIAADAGSRTTPRDWLAGLVPAEGRVAAARRTIAIGAAVAVLGFILPWASAPAATLVASWLDLWGLAGAGNWLIALGLVALGLVAAASGRTESWPVGLPALTVGAGLVGLVWPYVFGAVSRPFGVLVVLVGAVVLIAGGAIHLAGRHEAATPAV